MDQFLNEMTPEERGETRLTASEKLRAKSERGEEVTMAEKQLAWEEGQRAWMNDMSIQRLMYQAFGIVPVDWDEDDVRIRFGV